MNIDFNDLISDMNIVSYEEHRKSSEFFIRSIVKINKELFPEIPTELEGFWETNTYITNSDWGHELMNIYELDRVEEKVKMVETKYWEKVKNKGN